MNKSTRVLGIETSCDETGVAIYDPNQGILAQALSSSADIHAVYGGVVPELASRDHVRKLLPLIHSVLRDADLKQTQLDAIAYTAGPGLVGALLVGVAVGRSLAYALDIPAIAVHHMEAHLLAPMLEPVPPEFPFLALLVSGGHTLLVQVSALGRYKILGQSLDDAAGEAFDKIAKLLDLGYPGGAALSALAMRGNPDRFHFPRPMTQNVNLDFSFSGLKTFALHTLEAHPSAQADIARAFVDAAVDTLLIKCRWAIQQTGVRRLVVAGGVSANQQLRQRSSALAEELSTQIYFPRLEYCTDNGAMIAYTGYLHLRQGQAESLSFYAKPRWQIDAMTTELC